jgi:hypothetical protein
MGGNPARGPQDSYGAGPSGRGTRSDAPARLYARVSSTHW